MVSDGDRARIGGVACQRAAADMSRFFAASCPCHIQVFVLSIFDTDSL